MFSHCARLRPSAYISLALWVREWAHCHFRIHLHSQFTHKHFSYLSRIMTKLILDFFPLFFCILPHFRDIPEDVLNTYCWIHSTYTVVDAFMKKQGQEVPFPGVDNSQTRGQQLTIKHTKYYQWVAFTLFFQVSTKFWHLLDILLFHLPQRITRDPPAWDLIRRSTTSIKTVLRDWHKRATSSVKVFHFFYVVPKARKRAYMCGGGDDGQTSN